jgi:hypothetical protein
VAVLALEALVTLFGVMTWILLAAYIPNALARQPGGVTGFILKVTLAPATLALQMGTKILKAFAPAIGKSHQAVGTALHDAANLVTETANVVEAQAAITAELAQALAGTATAADLAIERAKLGKRITDAQQQAKGIGADVIPQAEAAARGIEAGIRPQINALDRELGRIEAQELPRIRARVGTAEGSLTNLWKWVHRNVATVGTLTFAGAVAWAIARLGGTWIRCNNWSKIGKAGCSLNPNLLESLLAGALVIASPISIVALAEACQKFTSEAEDGLKWFVRELS